MGLGMVGNSDNRAKSANVQMNLPTRAECGNRNGSISLKNGKIIS